MIMLMIATLVTCLPNSFWYNTLSLLYCSALNLHIYIALLAVHTNQKRFQLIKWMSQCLTISGRYSSPVLQPSPTQHYTTSLKQSAAWTPRSFCLSITSALDYSILGCARVVFVILLYKLTRPILSSSSLPNW